MNRSASYIYTDLACEAYERTDSVNASGVSYNEYDADGMKITDLRITGRDGEKALGKPIGSYITIDTGRLWEQEYDASLQAIKLIAANLNDLMHSACKKIESVLVCGLGNRNITPDAIGPLTIDGVTVTRHIKEEDPTLYNQMGAYDISAVNAGVVGQTGVETAEIIGSVVKTVKPSLIIAVDALAARNASRLATTVQMTDTGVRPGSGIGQKRREISKQTMNVPVIAIGVPTVASSATLVYDALDEAGAKVSPKLTEILENGKNFFVSLNESDVVVNKMAHVIAEAINHTLLAE
ncbi:MAG: GPR endopeptidase [Clostridiales bacterium]|nr:GPR endopeptidase [Clostridiales bacterium]